MSSGSDKTEAPTPKKLKEARKEGRIPRSPELTTWGAVLLGSYLLPLAIANTGARVRELVLSAGQAVADPDLGRATALVAAGGETLLASVLPLAAAMVVLGVAGNLAQTGLVLTGKRLKPKADKLNPLAGLKRMFSAESGWQLVKVLLRTAVLAFAAWVPLRHVIDALGASGARPLGSILSSTATEGLTMIRLVGVAGLLLGVLDYGISRKRIGKQNRMTKQEVRDEHKSTEGDPRVRQQIRQRQREVSRNRMLAAVADATVVVVNPTHVAVALRYEPGLGPPRVVAKGKGEVAKRIRAKAEEHHVPLVRDIALAWAVHDTCELDHPVPADLFEAVARVLAFVLTVGKRGSTYGGALTVPAGAAR